VFAIPPSPFSDYPSLIIFSQLGRRSFFSVVLPPPNFHSSSVMYRCPIPISYCFLFLPLVLCDSVIPTILPLKLSTKFKYSANKNAVLRKVVFSPPLTHLFFFFLFTYPPAGMAFFFNSWFPSPVSSLQQFWSAKQMV